jgi:hypothetical protein
MNEDLSGLPQAYLWHSSRPPIEVRSSLFLAVVYSLVAIVMVVLVVYVGIQTAGDLTKTLFGVLVMSPLWLIFASFGIACFSRAVQLRFDDQGISGRLLPRPIRWAEIARAMYFSNKIVETLTLELADGNTINLRQFILVSVLGGQFDLMRNRLEKGILEYPIEGTLLDPKVWIVIAVVIPAIGLGVFLAEKTQVSRENITLILLGYCALVGGTLISLKKKK